MKMRKIIRSFFGFHVFMCLPVEENNQHWSNGVLLTTGTSMILSEWVISLPSLVIYLTISSHHNSVIVAVYQEKETHIQFRTYYLS